MARAKQAATVEVRAHTVSEVAAMTRIPAATLYRYIERGIIKKARLGPGSRLIRIPIDEVKRMLQPAVE
jgi:excisionase family DNA binding protein